MQRCINDENRYIFEIAHDGTTFDAHTENKCMRLSFSKLSPYRVQRYEF